MFEIVFDLIWGLVFGIEHADLEPEEEGDPLWVIGIHLGLLRIAIIKH